MTNPILTVKKIFSRTGVLAFIWFAVAITLILACFTDVYVIIKDAVDWFRKW